MDETNKITKQQEEAKREWDYLKELGPIWHPCREPEAEERAAHGDIVLTSMAEALTHLDELKAQMEPAQAEQLERDFAFFGEQFLDDEPAASLALLGRETVDKVRQAVYVRAAARCLEQELQADLRHRFGTASDSWLEELWEVLDVEWGVVGLYAGHMEPFFKAAYGARRCTQREWRANARRRGRRPFQGDPQRPESDAAALTQLMQRTYDTSTKETTS
jgi:hypothetical protein